MPFYEYECQSCKFYTELMQKISDPPLEKCPSCGKSTMKKLISAPVFRLKGGGWYETDFKSDKENKRNLAAEREESKPAAEAAKLGDQGRPRRSRGEAAEAKTPSARPAEGPPRSAEASGQAAPPRKRPGCRRKTSAARERPRGQGKARRPGEGREARLEAVSS